MSNNGYIRMVVALLFEALRLLKENKKRDAEEYLNETIHILLNGK